MYFPFKFHMRCSQKEAPQDYVRIKRNRVRIIIRKEDQTEETSNSTDSLRVKIPSTKQTKVTQYDGHSIKTLSASYSPTPRFSGSHSSGMPLQF